MEAYILFYQIKVLGSLCLYVFIKNIFNDKYIKNGA